MPYDTIDELPERVRNVLTEGAQEVYLAAFNAALSEYGGNEQTAARVAWAAVSHQFEKGSDGKWHAIVETNRALVAQRAFYSKAEHVNAKHATVLQTLDRQVGDTFFDAEWFEPTVADWAKAPLIYVPKGKGHPDLDAYDEDPEAALAAVQGRIVDGAFADPSIAVAGHPRLVGTGDIKDKDIDALIAKGVLSLSTAFRAQVKDGHLAGPVQPHHILLFEEDEHNQPKDQGSGFLNKQEGDMTDTMVADLQEGLSFLDKAKSKLAGLRGAANKEKEEETNMADKELESKLAAATKELDELKSKQSTQATELKNKDEQMKQKDDEIAKLNKELETHRQAKADADWAAIRNKLPKGMVHGDEEKKSRELFEKDPAGFAQKVLDLKLKGNTQMEGGEQDGDAPSPKVGGMMWDSQLNKFVWK